MSIHADEERRIADNADPATALAFDLISNSSQPDDDGDLSSWVHPIDWPEFWTTDPPEQEWVIEPIVPAGRQVATYSPPKVGKSLLALDASAASATGRSVFGQPPKDAVDVIYIDQEMTQDDLRERLEDLGYGPDDDLSRLHYYQLVNLPPLDSDLGGEVVQAIVKRFNARLVVIDTMARVVAGDENQADTYRSFYRFTGLRLKALKVALWRLDHGGKDPERGQRGSSEKAGDVDVVFRLSANQDGLILKRTHTRIPWVPAQVTIHRDEDPCLAHRITPKVVAPVVVEIIAQLDKLDLPADASANDAYKALRTAQFGHRRTDVLDAVKVRKARS